MRGRKVQGERGSGRIYKNVAEFTKNAPEGRFAIAGMEDFLYICHQDAETDDPWGVVQT